MARRSPQAVDWVSLCREWRDSGQTQPEFCRRHGVPLHTFRRRLYRPSAEPGVDATRPAAAPPAGDRAPAFLAVRVVEDDRHSPASDLQPTPGGAVEVILGGGRRIVIPPGFDTGTLLRVIAALESPRC
jgi:hypothetical protein